MPSYLPVPKEIRDLLTELLDRAVTLTPSTPLAPTPKNPSTMQPRSSPTTSPSFSFRFPGIPCTTSSFTEMHSVAG